MKRRTIFALLPILLSLALLGERAPTSAYASAEAAPSLGVTTSRYPASRIAAGFGHSCIVLADGSIQCWGSNVQGELGNPTIFEGSDTPVSVSSGTGLTNVVAG